MELLTTLQTFLRLPLEQEDTVYGLKPANPAIARALSTQPIVSLEAVTTRFDDDGESLLATSSSDDSESLMVRFLSGILRSEPRNSTSSPTSDKPLRPKPAIRKPRASARMSRRRSISMSPPRVTGACKVTFATEIEIGPRGRSLSPQRQRVNDKVRSERLVLALANKHALAVRCRAAQVQATHRPSPFLSHTPSSGEFKLSAVSSGATALSFLLKTGEQALRTQHNDDAKASRRNPIPIHNDDIFARAGGYLSKSCDMAFSTLVDSRDSGKNR